MGAGQHASFPQQLRVCCGGGVERCVVGGVRLCSEVLQLCFIVIVAILLQLKTLHSGLMPIQYALQAHHALRNGHLTVFSDTSSARIVLAQLVTDQML